MANEIVIVIPCQMLVHKVCAAASLGMNTQNLVVYANHCHLLSDKVVPLFTQDNIMKHICVDLTII